MWHWLAHHMGTDNGGGGYYLWWSGFGANFGEIAVITGLIGFYRHHTCHVDHPRFCWRPGTHPIVGTPYKVCKRHHPDVPDRVTAAVVEASHEEAGGK